MTITGQPRTRGRVAYPAQPLTPSSAEHPTPLVRDSRRPQVLPSGNAFAIAVLYPATQTEPGASLGASKRANCSHRSHPQRIKAQVRRLGPTPAKAKIALTRQKSGVRVPQRPQLSAHNDFWLGKAKIAGSVRLRAARSGAPPMTKVRVASCVHRLQSPSIGPESARPAAKQSLGKTGQMRLPLHFFVWSTIVLSAVAGFQAPAEGAVQRASCVVRITRFSFSPATAPEGSAVTLGLAVRNCTSRTETVALTRFGTEPAGCPIIDPLTKTVTIKARSVYTERTPMIAPLCAGTEHMTERITQGGSQFAQATATLTVTARGG